MQWTEVTSHWKELGKHFKVKWTKLTDADLTAIAGKRDELVARLQKYYGTEKAKLAKEIDDFVMTLKAKV